MSNKFYAWSVVLLLMTIGMPLCAIAQDGADANMDFAKSHLDSLRSVVSPDAPDSVKARIYFETAIVTNNLDDRLALCQMSMDLCKDSDTALIVHNLPVMAYCYYVQDNRDMLMSVLDRGIALAIKSNNLYELQKMFKLKAMYFEKVNVFDSVYPYYNRALEVCIRIKDTSQIAGCYMNLALNYTNNRYYDEAEATYLKAIEYDSIIGEQLELAVAYYNFGQLYYINDKNDYIKAKKYLKKAIDIFETQKDYGIRYVISKYLTYNVLAKVYLLLAEENDDRQLADSCNYYNKQSMDYFLSAGYNDYYDYMSMTYVDYLCFCKKYKEALKFLLDLEETLNPDYTDLLNTYYESLKDVYYELGDYKNAYDVYDKFFETNIMVYNEKSMLKIADAKAEQVALNEKLKYENAERLHESETKRLQTLNISLIVGLVLVSLLVFYILKALRIRQNANKVLSEKNHEISAQKDIIVAQWHEVESANKKLLGSINYAKRIQYAAVSKPEEVRKMFPDSFVYYCPRDIVSGDFYYVAKCGRYSVMITADCTGHGIPGAFLSMLGISALKEYCVTEDDAAAPGTILDRMRNFIKETLVSETPKITIDDGMDMTICCYDFERMELRCAAANQIAYIVRRGNLIKLKGDRMPVGRYIVEKDHFQTLVQPIEKGDVIYTCSDGIQDQIGGSEDYLLGKKMQADTLIKFLLENYDKPMDTQCEILDTFVNEWRNGRPQVDDMTLIGVRV